MSRGERRINAKSIMGVMMLAAGMGTEVEMETDGEQEQEAMDALLALMPTSSARANDPRPGPQRPGRAAPGDR
jgi:phosphotransferase system HPr-like phosphotransfer protein